MAIKQHKNKDHSVHCHFSREQDKLDHLRDVLIFSEAKYHFGMIKYCRERNSQQYIKYHMMYLAGLGMDHGETNKAFGQFK